MYRMDAAYPLPVLFATRAVQLASLSGKAANQRWARRKAYVLITVSAMHVHLPAGQSTRANASNPAARVVRVEALY